MPKVEISWGSVTVRARTPSSEGSGDGYVYVCVRNEKDLGLLENPRSLQIQRLLVLLVKSAYRRRRCDFRVAWLR